MIVSLRFSRCFRSAYIRCGNSVNIIRELIALNDLISNSIYEINSQRNLFDFYFRTNYLNLYSELCLYLFFVFHVELSISLVPLLC